MVQVLFPQLGRSSRGLAGSGGAGRRGGGAHTAGRRTDFEGSAAAPGSAEPLTQQHRLLSSIHHHQEVLKVLLQHLSGSRGGSGGFVGARCSSSGAHQAGLARAAAAPGSTEPLTQEQQQLLFSLQQHREVMQVLCPDLPGSSSGCGVSANAGRSSGSAHQGVLGEAAAEPGAASETQLPHQMHQFLRQPHQQPQPQQQPQQAPLQQQQQQPQVTTQVSALQQQQQQVQLEAAPVPLTLPGQMQALSACT